MIDWKTLISEIAQPVILYIVIPVLVAAYAWIELKILKENRYTHEVRRILHKIAAIALDKGWIPGPDQKTMTHIVVPMNELAMELTDKEQDFIKKELGSLEVALAEAGKLI